jgi:hypothetical protein
VFQKNLVFALVTSVIFSALIILCTTSNGFAANNFLSVSKALVRVSGDHASSLFMITKGKIPKDGSEGAFGYGAISSTSSKAFKVAIVTVTHKGILDSDLQQGDRNSSVFHNHYVLIGPSRICRGDLAVWGITSESPGNVAVIGQDIAITNLPKSSGGITPNPDIQDVVSFKLVIKGDRRHHEVCATEIQPANKFIVK